MNRTQGMGALIALGLFGVLGALSLAAGQPLLVPSLGPTVFIQLETPDQPSARPWNVMAGHSAGLLAGVLALAVTGALHTPSPILTGVLSWQRELACAVGVGLSFLGQSKLKASHPPAAASTLLITLGAIEPEWRGVALIAAAVALTALMGEAGRRFVRRRE